jgi:hypothetical protein
LWEAQRADREAFEQIKERERVCFVASLAHENLTGEEREARRLAQERQLASSDVSDNEECEPDGDFVERKRARRPASAMAPRPRAAAVESARVAAALPAAPPAALHHLLPDPLADPEDGNATPIYGDPRATLPATTLPLPPRASHSAAQTPKRNRAGADTASSSGSSTDNTVLTTAEPPIVTRQVTPPGRAPANAAPHAPQHPYSLSSLLGATAESPIVLD